MRAKMAEIKRGEYFLYIVILLYKLTGTHSRCTVICKSTSTHAIIASNRVFATRHALFQGLCVEVFAVIDYPITFVFICKAITKKMLQVLLCIFFIYLQKVMQYQKYNVFCETMESYYNRFSYHTNDKVKIHLKPKGTGELKNSKI